MQIQMDHSDINLAPPELANLTWRKMVREDLGMSITPGAVQAYAQLGFTTISCRARYERSVD